MIQPLFKHEALTNIGIDSLQVDEGDELLISHPHEGLQGHRSLVPVTEVRRAVYSAGRKVEISDQEYRSAIQGGLIKSTE